jgi:hypothetical protein
MPRIEQRGRRKPELHELDARVVCAGEVIRYDHEPAIHDLSSFTALFCEALSKVYFNAGGPTPHQFYLKTDHNQKRIPKGRI